MRLVISLDIFFPMRSGDAIATPRFGQKEHSVGSSPILQELAATKDYVRETWVVLARDSGGTGHQQIIFECSSWMKFPILRMLSFLVGYLDSMYFFDSVYIPLQHNLSSQLLLAGGPARIQPAQPVQTHPFFPSQCSFPPPRYGSGSDTRFLA